MRLFNLLRLTLLVRTIEAATSTDAFKIFDTNQPFCTVLTKVVNALPTSASRAVTNFCTEFVGSMATTLTKTVYVFPTVNKPLKTITVTGSVKKRTADPNDQLTTTVFDSPLTSSTPLPASQILLPRALTTPSIFKDQASLAIRTGCACLGYSTKQSITHFVASTTTATSAPVAASCARSPLLNYRFTALAPAAVTSAIYNYGTGTTSVAECCRFCTNGQDMGCLYFTYTGSVDAAVCTLYFLTYYDPGSGLAPGIPAMAADQAICPRGYLAAQGLVRDTRPALASTGTFLGPCIVTTVR